MNCLDPLNDALRLDPAEITSKIWRYLAAPGGLLGNLVFRADGRIAGYLHPNEAFWRLTDQCLEILDITGSPSRRFLLENRRDKRWSGNAVSTQHSFWLEENLTHPIAVPYADDVLQMAKGRRFYLAHLAQQEGVYSSGDTIHFYPGAEIEPGATLPVGSFVKIGAFSYVVGAVRANLTIGRFCSIAAGLAVFGDSHPTNWLSSSPMSYAGHHQRFFQDAGVEAPPDIQPWEAGNAHIATHIGSDVWVGAGVLLKPGITIGTGAVIAARSIVTKSVPPYAIVGGSPARIIKYRFDASLIERMIESEWWMYDLSGVKLNWRDPSGAVETISRLSCRGRIPRLDFAPYDATRALLAGRVLKLTPSQSAYRAT